MKFMSSIYDFSVKMADGSTLNLADYKGKPLIIVNTASKCGFTPQFKGLEELYEKYKEQGLVIIGFPCNQFKEQEPGSGEEAAGFCQRNYGVTFPITEKVEVNGENTHPVFAWLKANSTMKDIGKLGLSAMLLNLFTRKKNADGSESSDIRWNFTKFLLDKEGRVAERFEPTEKPEDMEKLLQTLL
jgi:glutathione peroxidase